MNLPVLGALDAPLMLENIPALEEEIRALAQERDALILAHNYQLPEIQDVAHYVGDSLGLHSRRLRPTPTRSSSAESISWPRQPRSCVRTGVC